LLSDTQNVTVNSIHVNSLCEDIHKNRSVVLNSILYEIVLSHQDSKLASDIGPRYTRDKQAASFSCPCCGSRLFIRKGKRYRTYKSALGKSKIPVLQVQCCCCGYRFCPYKDEIGLAFRARISQALLQRQLELTCQIPYRRAREFIAACLGVSASCAKVRKEIDRQAEQIRNQPVSASGEVVYDDSTKVKAGKKERGVSIHLAITAKHGQSREGRRAINKRLLFLKTGNAEKIKKSLKALDARGIVHDGDMDLSGCAKHIQRCLWHLAHQLKHFLWLDGVPFEARWPYVNELIHILFWSVTVKNMKDQYSRFIARLRKNGLLKSYGHLKKAETELTTSREQGFAFHTTTPVEREMREINRRADVGVRWSIPGVENLLLVKTHLMLNGP